MRRPIKQGSTPSKNFNSANSSGSSTTKAGGINSTNTSISSTTFTTPRRDNHGTAGKENPKRGVDGDKDEDEDADGETESPLSSARKNQQHNNVPVKGHMPIQLSAVRILVAIVLLAVLGTGVLPFVRIPNPLDPQERKPLITQRKAIFGFLPEYRMQGSMDVTRFSEVVTHLVLFSIELDPGKTTGGKSPPGARREWPLKDLDRLPAVGSKLLTDLQKEAQRTGIKIMIAIGGAGRSHGFAQVANDASLRKATAKALVELCVERGFSGVELNWQFPTSLKDMKAFGEFAAEIKTQSSFSSLKDLLLVTTAIPPQANYAQALVEGSAEKHFDYLHCMLYLEAVGGVNPVQRVEKTMSALIKHISPKKLTLGVPFYGVSQRTGDAKTHEELLQLSMDQRKDYFFEGKDILRSKLTLIEKLGLGGVSIWELGQDAKSKDDSLLSVVAEMGSIKFDQVQV